MSPNSISASALQTAFPYRLIAFVYGVAAYLFFLATFLYLIAFVADVFVPKGVDGGAATGTGPALAINMLLIALFGIQHSVMARPGFKRAWTRLVPTPVERSTYVLVSSLVLAFVMWMWQPMPAPVWQVENAVGFWLLWALFGIGWTVLLLSTFMTDHFDLFGLRQIYLYLTRQPYRPVEFKARGFYKHIRHPLYAGFLIGFWATPDMTLGHLVLASGFSIYIVVGTLFEERDLIAAFGDSYREYSRRLPRYLPRLTSRGK